jgi:regulator of protease activity HflC (stomatin/prohibitin superfamily)
MSALLMLLVQLLVPLIGGMTTIARTIKFVQEGELGIKLRFGKVVCKNGKPKVIQPGFCLLIPFVDKLHRRHVRQQTIRCDHQEVQLKDKTVFDVSAVAYFRVVDIYKALFVIDDLTSSVNDLCMSVLRDEFSERGMNNANETTGISDSILVELRKRADEWGVEFNDFRLTNCSPTPETLQLLLVEQQGVQRVKALQAAAKELGWEPKDIPPAIAASLIGIPVATSIGGSSVTTNSTNNSVTKNKDDHLNEITDDWEL